MNNKVFQWKTYWELARPDEYLKNFLVLAPLFFAGDFLVVEKLIPATVAFLVFCLLASGSYAINDVFDAKSDRHHPVKQGRPVASGRISPGFALTAACLWIGVGIAISAAVSQVFLLAGGAYLVLQLLYSVMLKHWPLCDILAISAGFILRLIAGGLAVQVYVSIWLIICTGLLTLFLAIGKRRCELTVLKNPITHRKVFQYYNHTLLDNGLILTGVLAMGSYMVCLCFSGLGVESFNSGVIFTIPLVAAGLCRFSTIFRHDCLCRGIVEIIFQDTIIKTIVAAWVCIYFAVLYL